MTLSAETLDVSKTEELNLILIWSCWLFYTTLPSGHCWRVVLLVEICIYLSYRIFIQEENISSILLHILIFKKNNLPTCNFSWSAKLKQVILLLTEDLCLCKKAIVLVA